MAKKPNVVENETPEETLEQVAEEVVVEEPVIDAPQEPVPVHPDEDKYKKHDDKVLIHVEDGQVFWKPSDHGRPVAIALKSGTQAVMVSEINDYSAQGVKFRNIE